MQPQWHKGPCDCGLFALFEKLNASDIAPARSERELIKASPAYKRWENRGEHER